MLAAVAATALITAFFEDEDEDLTGETGDFAGGDGKGKGDTGNSGGENGGLVLILGVEAVGGSANG